MLDHKELEKVDHLIVTGKLEEAFKLLNDNIMFFPSPYKQDFGVLSSQFYTLMNQRKVSLSGPDPTLNKIVFGTLELLSILKADESLREVVLSQEVLAVNHGRLLFQFHNQALSNFKIAYQQLKTFFADFSPSDRGVEQIVVYVQELIHFADRTSELQLFVENERRTYGNLELIETSERYIAYAFEEMTLNELENRRKALESLIQQFKNQEKSTVSWWAIVVVVVVALLLLLGYLVSNI